MLWKDKKRNDRSDSGSAIVTVIVVVAFISVIATTLLYITGVNYRMKNVDYQNKTSFYAGEVPLEEIKARFAWELADSCVEAYGKVMGQYALLSEGNRARQFQEYVREDLEKKWDDSYTLLGGDWSQVIRSYVESAYGGSISIRYPDPLPDGYKPYVYDEVKGTLIFRGILLEYERDGYLTTISTDIYIAIPVLDWSAQSSRYDFAGMTAEQIADALKRETIDTSDCVVYVNWSKD